MSSELTTAQAAAVLGVHPVTLRKWRKGSEYTGEFDVWEDCQGLQWWYRQGRQIMYDEMSVNRLKAILNRRKGTKK
jgi:hypothetical protein